MSAFQKCIIEIATRMVPVTGLAHELTVHLPLRERFSGMSLESNLKSGQVICQNYQCAVCFDINFLDKHLFTSLPSVE